MITLYHSPDSRSSRFIWLLEELGAQYELVYCDIPRRRGTGAPDAANPHPDKMVPALLHDGALISESAAIALYLTDLFPEAALGPTVGQAGRGAYLTWLAYNAGEMEPAFAAKLAGHLASDPFAARAFDRVLRRVAAALAAAPYIMGQQFSAADILVASPFQWYRNLAPESELIDAWLERLSTRPAALRAARTSARRASDAIPEPRETQ